MFYGLNIQSEIPLFNLHPVAVGAKFDVSVFLDSQLVAPDSGAQVNSKEATFYLRNAGVFNISRGKEIRVKVSEGVDHREVARILLGIPMGYLLYQRGLHVLHASVVNIDGHAAAFTGLSGSGKSTCAASFLNQGHSILTGDVAAVDLANNLSVTSAFSWVKTGRDVWRHLKLPRRSVISASADKRNRVLYPLDERQFCTVSTPLKNCYLLEWGDQIKIEPIAAQQSFSHLFPHIFRPVNSSGSSKDDARSFRNMTDFSKQVAVFRLTRPKSLEKLDECRILVEEHMKQTTNHLFVSAT